MSEFVEFNCPFCDTGITEDMLQDAIVDGLDARDHTSVYCPNEDCEKELDVLVEFEPRFYLETRKE